MNKDDFKRFQEFCATHGLILDTNLLILYIVGETNKNKIEHFDLTNSYSPELYELIKILVKSSKFKAPIITPHIVCETSHHLGLDSNHTTTLSPWLKKSLKIFNESYECHVKTKDIIDPNGRPLKILAHYGIPDLSIADLSTQKDYAVLTDDCQLFTYIYKEGQKNVVNTGMLNTIVYNKNRNYH